MRRCSTPIDNEAGRDYCRSMTYSWQNEDGEPIMSGEAWRFEQALDAEYDEQRERTNDYDPWDEGEAYECPDCGKDPDECGCPEPDYVPVAEDAWLDGAYEQ